MNDDVRGLTLVFFILLMIVAAGWVVTGIMYAKLDARNDHSEWQLFRVYALLDGLQLTEGHLTSGGRDEFAGSVAFLEKYYGTNIDLSSEAIRTLYAWQAVPLIEDFHKITSDEFVQQLAERLSEQDARSLLSGGGFETATYGVEFTDHRVKVAEALESMLFDELREKLKESLEADSSGI